MDRSQFLLSLFDPSGTGLEIGPSFNPLLPKSQGHTIEILDHMSAAALREKYKDAPVDPSKIEEVDYVSDGGSIAELIGKPGHYDHIVALHVIEHTTDLLGFLLDCQTLLKEHGVLVLAIPDKRYSFDTLRPLSSCGDVLQAHLERRKRHSPGAIFDEVAYNCLRAGAHAWPPGSDGPLRFFQPLSAAKHHFEQAQRNEGMHDIHAWQFTPSSFRLIVNDLVEIGYLGLRERSFHDHNSSEFFVTLSKSAVGCPVDRMTLAQRTIDEQKAIAVPGEGKKAADVVPLPSRSQSGWAGMVQRIRGR